MYFEHSYSNILFVSFQVNNFGTNCELSSQQFLTVKFLNIFNMKNQSFIFILTPISY